MTRGSVGCWWRSERPKSPWTARHRKSPYCSGSGRSKPRGRAQDLVVLLGALGPHVERGRIAREVDDDEHDRGDPEEHECRPRQALEEIRNHIGLLSLVRERAMLSGA
jgi:hypothetical protein